MKIREVMHPDPVCCLPTDSAQKVAQTMCENNVGSIPVVADQQSKQLIGMITDRDLCCSVLAAGSDARKTTIENVFSSEVISCRDGENLDHCQKAMQEHQVRRIPIVDGENRVIGIVSQADVALKDRPEKVSRTLAEVSKPQRSSRAA